MKHFNFLSNLLSLSLGSPCTDVSLDRRLTVGSPSGFGSKSLLKLVSVLALIFTLGVGSVWGADPTVTYTQSSTSAIAVTAGTAPYGSSVTFATTYTDKNQLTSGKIQTLTLSGYNKVTISNITLSMKSNSSSGAGKLYYSTDNGTTWTYIVGTDKAGVAFNNSAWKGSWSTSYSNISKDVSISCSASNVIIKIEATASSIYCQSFKLTYSVPSYTVAWEANGTNWTGASHGSPSTSVSYNAQPSTLPTAPVSSDCDNSRVFVGWTNAAYSHASTAPTILFTSSGEAPRITGNSTFYAVFANRSGSAPSNNSGPSYTRSSNADSYTSGYTFTSSNAGTSTSYRAESGSAGSTTTLKVYHTSTAVFSSTPTSIKVTAKIGGGSGTTSLTYPVYAQLLDKSGNGIGTAVAITDYITSSSGDTYSDVNIPTAGITSAYGIMLYHVKQSGFNVRFYSFSFSYQTGGYTYSNYTTSCCTQLGSINGSVSWLSPDSAVVTWNELSDQVSSWAISWSPNTTGSSGLGIRDKGTTLKDTIIGLACNTDYTFTLTPTIKSGVCTPASNPTIESTSSKYDITLTDDGTVTGGLFSVTDGDDDIDKACSGDPLSLEAVAADGYEFTNWEITYTDSGDDAWDDVEDTGDATDDEIIIAMPAADITVNAVFSCVEPVIGTQPADASYIKDASPTALSVSATLSSGTLTYLWKVSTNGGSTWSDAGGTNNAATYSGSSLSTASTGTLKFKCIVGNSEGGCTVESNVATITINAGSTWKFKYSGDSYTEHTMTESDGVASYSISLAADTRFEFCIDDNGTAYKNNGTIITTTSGWVFNTSDNNCKIHTGPAGTYTFAINTTSKAVTVTYPTVDHPNDHYVYFKNTNVWGTVYGYLANSGNDNKAAAWPGSVMAATTTICGETYHYAALNAMSGTYNTIIFNNGNSGYGNQTSDLSTTGSLGKYNANSDAAWHQFKYAISFDKGTGSGDAMSSIENLCPGSNQALTACSYTKDHHTFAGWYADVDVKVGESTIEAENIIDDEVTIKDIQSDITLTAQWSANIYTITKTLTNVSNASLPTSFTYTGATTTALNSTFTVNTTNFFMPSSITVTMGGSTLTAGTDYTYNSSTGAFTFDVTITGDIVITATATAKLMSIAITTAPTKTAYFAGETFSATGAVVTATMGDGTTKAVSGSATWTPTGALTAESGKTMTATYTEAGITKTATTTINVYAVTMQAKDESGDAIAVGGPGAPSRSVTSISPAADAGNYVFKQWTISGASLGSSATTKSNTISTPTGAVTVTAVYYKPRVIKWSVNNDDSYEEGTPTLAVAYNTAISAVPTAPDDDALNNCANKFMGWSTTNITKGSPVTAADDIAALGLFTNASGYTTKITAATTTFYAVFAEKTVVRDEGYYKVTSTGDITNDGRYLIVNETSEVVFDGSLDVPDAGENVVSISDKISAGAITVDDDNRENLANAEFTIDMTNKYVKSHSNQYIYQDTYSNGMSYSSEPAEVQSISIDGSGNLVIEGKGQNKSNPYDYVLLRWNSTTGSTNWRFRFYKGTQNPIQLYAYDLGYSYTNYVTQCADNQVRVTYDFNGGTGTACTEGVTTKSASYTVCSTEPEKDYYDFAGWNDGTSTYNAGATSYNLQDNTTFTAQWTATEYSITYNLNDGTQQVSPAPATSYTYESSDITLPTAPTKGHSRFDGWFDNSGLTGSAVTTIAAGSHGDKEYWAKWTDRHTIVFDADGSETTIYRASDEALNASLAGQGSVPDDPDAPSTCSSKVFMGWTETEIYDYTNSAPADLMNTYTGTVSADKHYYAVWATRSGSVGSYTYSAYATTCCDNHVTLSSPSITGSGTVVFAPVSPAEASPDGTYATCRNDISVTATVTPASGYSCTALSFTRSDSKDVDIDPTISGNLPSAPSAQDFVLSFDKNTDVTVTTAATFTAKGVTGWTWKQATVEEQIDIPATVDLYIGQEAWFDLISFTPSDVISDYKGYTPTYNSDDLAQGGKGATRYKIRAKVAKSSMSLTLTSDNNGSVQEVITIRGTALPTATFVDNIHNKTDFTTGDAALPASGILSATIDGTDKRIVYLTQKTPNHADVVEPGSGNACEKSHLHLVGWIDKDWADEHPNATHSEIMSAGTGVFYEPNANIDLAAKNGKTFLAVWSKIE